ncbi:hypothetical protein JOB18_020817 [Solea senegalensis]|uniref:Tudor domain-containing protein 5 n=1 Tax=Solea senegalensis TaxID=28829 RepID=A0AAV6SBG5_SOLSE|nr:hypothetical protein JOB18_020817 [Solea senegalensis]
MNQEEVLAHLKRDIRALLTSSKMGLDPDQLRRDYVEMLGHPMPLKLLGFRNIMDMVKDMPDVVSIGINADGTICLNAVSDETTQNIKKLVGKQRMSKADRRTKRVSASYFSPHYSRISPSVVLPRRGCGPPPLPAQLRAQLCFLLSQGPLRLSDLEGCFLRCFGHPLRCQSYGFYTTGEMLAALTDLVIIQQSRLGSLIRLRDHMVTRPVLIPFNSARKTGPSMPLLHRTNKPPFKGPGNSAPSAGLHPVSLKQSPVTQSSAETPMDPVCKEPITVRNKPNLVEKNQEVEPGLSQEDHLLQKCILKLEEELHRTILENGIASTISLELKDKLQKVVGQARDGLSVHDLPAEYKRLLGEELPLQQSGFFSVTELISAMSDIFHLKPAEDDSGHHWVIMNVKDIDAPLSDSKETENCNSGEELSYTSIDFSCEESPWEGKREADDNNTDVESEELETSSNSKIREMVSEKYTVVQVHCNPALPLDAMRSQRLQPPTRHSARELVQVTVEQVDSPAHFYIRFSDSKEAQAMEDMMIEMRRCYTYSDVAEGYRLPKKFVRRGQACCVSPAGLWFYRVVIQKIVSPTQVEVYFVDFGDTTVVQSASLKFLKLCYSVLPAQAVPSSLAGIKPTSGSWTAEAVASFQKLCCDRTLVGALDCYTGDVLQLYLCDTRTAHDVYVHTALMNQGHGKPCSPAESAALCVQSNPASLYLGEGKVDLLEFEEEMTSTEPANTPDESMPSSLKEEEEEMPALEFIESSEVSSDTQAARANPLSFVLNDQALSCHELGPVLTNEPSPTNTTTTTSAPLTAPDLIQTKTTSAEVTKMSPQATPSSFNSSPCCQTQEKEKYQSNVTVPLLVRPPPILRTLSLHTPYLGQIQHCNQGAPVSLLHQRSTSIMFPLFGSR